MEVIGNGGVRSWATVIDDVTVRQAEKTSRLKDAEGNSLLAGPVVLMPDAHLGIGSTVGSVLVTENILIPSAIGVDAGCGMIAARTSLSQDQLPDSLDGFLPAVEEAVPAGLGHWHAEATTAAGRWFEAHPHDLPHELAAKALKQFGSMGSGNHFFEVEVDELGGVWLMLHSGSRGVGNQLAEQHIASTKASARLFDRPLEDPDLAYLIQGSPDFERYLDDMLWSQQYAMGSREAMMSAALRAFFAFVGTGFEVSRVNCHHNYTVRERHDGRDLWVTRKGAINAEQGVYGLIPGSMGTGSFLVEGLGDPLSYNSAPHGAGRAMSRGQAHRELDVDVFAAQMADAGIAWQRDKAEALLDEAPDAYKPIGQVIEDSASLVRVVHRFHQVLNYKGTDDGRRANRQRKGAAAQTRTPRGKRERDRGTWKRDADGNFHPPAEEQS